MAEGATAGGREGVNRREGGRAGSNAGVRAKGRVERAGLSGAGRKRWRVSTSWGPSYRCRRVRTRRSSRVTRLR